MALKDPFSWQLAFLYLVSLIDLKKNISNIHLDFLTFETSHRKILIWEKYSKHSSICNIGWFSAKLIVMRMNSFLNETLQFRVIRRSDNSWHASGKSSKLNKCYFREWSWCFPYCQVTFCLFIEVIVEYHTDRRCKREKLPASTTEKNQNGLQPTSPISWTSH